jgi:hypothetical protein
MRDTTHTLTDCGASVVEEQTERLNQVRSRRFDRLALARDIELWTQRLKGVVLPFNDGRQPARA